MEDLFDNRDLSVTGAAANRPATSQAARDSGLQSLPAAAREEFPRLEVTTERDLQIVAGQLGRPPRGEIFVARRCEFGRPTVLLTLWDREGGSPVPPLLWLSCPYQVREASRMESSGTISRYTDALKRKGADDLEKQLFVEGEERFGRVQTLLSVSGSGAFAGKRDSRGVAGGRPGAVKCLHAHLAYRLASGRGVVGGWCLRELDNGRGRICERIPEACLG